MPCSWSCRKKDPKVLDPSGTRRRRSLRHGLPGRGLTPWRVSLPGLESSQPLLPGHHGCSWLPHPMAIINLVSSISSSHVCFLRPWTTAGETLEICRPESLRFIMLPAESYFFSPYTSPHWLFPNQPLNMAPIVLPEYLTCLFNEATILQLSHRHSPPFQTNPWYRRAISLSSEKTLFPWPLDFDSSCILTSSDILLNSDFSPQIQFCMSTGLQDPCAECHDITEFPHSVLHIELTIYHNPLPVWLSPTRFLMAAFSHSHLVTTEGWE